MVNTFFTSDLHFWHTNVIRYCNRPYSSVEEMNEKLISNWNEVVKPEDTIYCLGDFSMAFRSVELFSHKLNGKRLLVPGNHDFCHSAHKKGKKDKEKWTKRYEYYGWTVMPEHVTMDVPGVGTVNMSHMPYVGDHTEGTRYLEHRPKNDGLWLLHGHTHGLWRVKGKQIDVGVDANNYYPVNLEVLTDVMQEEGFFCQDCGADTVSGSGSARCSECWNSRNGN